MVIENVTTSNELMSTLINEFSSLTTLFKAFGGLVLAYVLFNIINVIINWKKRQDLKEIKKSVKKIEKINKK